MVDEIIIDTKPVAIAEITKDEFIAMAEADKIKVLIAEKEAKLAEKDLDSLKSAFYEAQRETLAGFDADANLRMGTFMAQLSTERAVIEKKFKDAEALGTWVIPL